MTAISGDWVDEAGGDQRGELDVLAVRRAAHDGAPPGVERDKLRLAPCRRLPWERNARAASLLTYGSRRRSALFPVELPLDWAAGAVCDAYVALGELSGSVRDSLTLAPRPDGWLRVSLPAADSDETSRVMAALGELLEEAPAPRYLLSRQACDSPTRTAGMRTLWDLVPTDLARRRDRAKAFQAAWTRWCGPSELVYPHNAPEARASSPRLRGRPWPVECGARRRRRSEGGAGPRQDG